MSVPAGALRVCVTGQWGCPKLWSQCPDAREAAEGCCLCPTDQDSTAQSGNRPTGL